MKEIVARIRMIESEGQCNKSVGHLKGNPGKEDEVVWSCRKECKWNGSTREKSKA